MRNNFTGHLPPLRSYAEAAALEASIKPIRGRAETEKPLMADRSRNYIQIKRRPPGIVITIGHSYVLTYYEDGRIYINSASWAINREIIGMLLSTSLRTQFYVSWIWCSWEGGEGWLPTASNKVFTFTDRLTCPEPVFPTVWRVDRKKFNPIRDKYFAFGAYFMGFVKLMADNPPLYRSNIPLRELNSHLDKCMLSCEPTDKYEAAMQIMGYDTYSLDVAKRKYTEALLRMHPHVLKQVTITSGKMFKDTYRHIGQQLLEEGKVRKD